MNRLIHILIHAWAFFSPWFCADLYAMVRQQVTVDLPVSRHPQSSCLEELSTSHLEDNRTFSPDSGKIREDIGAESPSGNGAGIMLHDSSQLKTYQLPELVVTSSRVRQTASYTPSFVTIVNKDEIDGLNATSLAQVLSPVAGIFIKDYGDASGLKTISQRGLGTEHTLILLNGIRVSSTQNGLVDLGVMPVDEIGAVEIVRGGQSASYGADAVAGLVNVITKPVDSRNTAQVSSSVGSFGYHRYLISGNLSSGLGGIRLSYGQEQSQGDFPFQFRNGPLVWNLVRGNSDLLARYANAQGDLLIGDWTRLAIVASTYSSERGVPGALVSPYATSQARQIDSDHLIQTSFASDVAEDLTLGFTAQAHFSYERYRDPNLNIGGRSLDTYFRNDDIRIEPHINMKMSEGMRVSAGVELANTTANGNSLDRKALRKQMGAFVVGEAALVRSNDVVSGVTVFPSLRYDAVSSIDPVWSPQLGALVALKEFDAGPLSRVRPSIRSSVSRNFRMPTFNELYFSGGGGFGDPGLRPEHSTSIDVGGSLQFSLAGEQQVQITHYANDMNDRIIWAAASGNSVVPKNLRQVRSTGLEGYYRWDLPEKMLSLQMSYATSSSRKISADYPGDPTVNTQLAYVPKRMLSFSASSTIDVGTSLVKDLGVVVAYSFVGYRYVTEDNSQFLPSYQLVNLSLRGCLFIRPLSILGKFEVNNLLNEAYEVMPGYPMPQRSYRVTIGLGY